MDTLFLIRQSLILDNLKQDRLRHMFTGASFGVRTLMLRFHCHGIKIDLMYVDYNSDSFEPSSAHSTWDLNLTEWLINDFTFPRNAAVAST